MAMRDSRFGQFADPGFGASLSQSGASDPGVLPAPDQPTSASDNTPAQSFQFPGMPAGFSGTPGLLPQPNGSSNPGSMYLAEGGMIDDDQDSGNAQPAGGDPFAFISAALSTGRKKFGLPQDFFGNNAAAPSAPDGDGDEDDTQSFAEGGEVEGDEPQEGVIPDGNTDQEDMGGQDQMTPSGNGGQGALGYLKGEGAVGPEIAAALEQQVDPQGSMPPAQRKMMAVASAGDPDKAFGVMQHYRQKFNAYGAFAKAALQGSGGRPPNPAAAADALTKAYDHIPDGKSLRFMPVQGGMRVQINDGQQQQPTQNFAEGGEVGAEDDELQQARADDRVQPERNAPMLSEGQSSAQEGVMPTEADAPAPMGDKDHMANGNAAPHKVIRDFVLSIPQLLGWQAKDGQFDSSLDKGVEQTLADAAKNQTPQGMAPQGPQQPPAMAAPQPGGQLDPNYQQGVQNDAAARQNDFNQQRAAAPQAPPVKETPKDAEKFGAQVGDKGGAEGATLAAILHEIDQAYPFVGMSRERAVARAAARQHWADNRTKIEAEQTKGANADNRARIAAGAKVDVANIGGDVKRDVVQQQQTGAGERNARTNDTREKNAASTQGAAMERTRVTEEGKNQRNDITNKPSLVGNKEKIDAARTARGGGQQQQPQQQAPQKQGTQLPPEAVRALSEGKVTTFKNGQRWTLKGGVPQQVQ